LHRENKSLGEIFLRGKWEQGIKIIDHAAAITKRLARRTGPVAIESGAVAAKQNVGGETSRSRIVADGQPATANEVFKKL